MPTNFTFTEFAETIQLILEIEEYRIRRPLPASTCIRGCRPEERGSDHCNIIPGLVNYEVVCLTVEIETKADEYSQ